ncbi:MAG: alpha-ketoacid dehydrogenase subunit alpha/beta [Chthonomonadales bacterium]
MTIEPALRASHTSLPALDLLRIMQISREGDRREGILLRQSRGWFHVAGMGHEAIAALAYLLEPRDCLFPYYRDRALCLARGVTNYELALAYFGKAASSSAGRQMPGHFSSAALRIFSVATPTASQCLPAAGAAWAQKLADTGGVVLCCVGDAAIRQGEYFEAVAFAVQEALPLVMVVEDNFYGISTSTLRHNPHRLRIINEEYVVRVNGRDAYEVFAKGAEAIARARSGGGPTILWCEVDRLAPHTSSDDHRVYRSTQELQEIASRDPILNLRDRLIARQELRLEDWEAFCTRTAEDVEADYARAEEAPDPDPDEAASCLASPPPDPQAPPLPAPDGTTMVVAINRTLEAAMAEDPTILVMGEDVEDPKGGVFGLTKGLSTRYPGRVVNAPLAEATIIGTAVGLASAGYRPVFEIQFIDFISPGFNQLVTQVATASWRSNGEWQCPVTFIAPSGAYLPGGGPWHSQTNEGIWCHIPGLQVVVPSTPQDAAGLLWSVIHGKNPTLFLVPKHIFRKRLSVAEWEPVPLGRCAVRREGTDVTLVAWGNGMELAHEAAEQAGREGISVELLDLRTLAPCDWEGIEASVAKTGRLVVIDEDARTGCFGQSVIAELTAYPRRWASFFSAPQLVARRDVHVPFRPSLEYAVLPSIDQVLCALRAVME